MKQIAKYTKNMSEMFVFWSNIRTNPFDTVIFDLFDIYGQELDLCEEIIKYIFDQAKINTSDINYITYIYKSFIPIISDTDIITVSSDNVVLTESSSLEDFFLSTNRHILNTIENNNPFIIDNEKNTLYTSQEYKDLTITISGLNFKLQQVKVPVWNMFDDLGDLVSLKRLPNESNLLYKNRIKDVFVHLPGNNFDGLVNAISRELDIRLYLNWTDTREDFILYDRNIFIDSISIVYLNGVIEYPDIYINEDNNLVISKLSGQIEDVRVSYVQYLTIHDLNDKKDYFVSQYYYNKNKTAKKNLINFARKIRTNTYQNFIIDQTYKQQKSQNVLPSLYDGSINGFKKYNHMTIEEVQYKALLTEK